MSRSRASLPSPPPLAPEAVRRLLERLVQRPAPEGARLVLRGWVDDLRAATRRWEEAPSADALHDLRVAVRRVRFVGRALRPLLAGAYPRAVRRAMRRMARATGDLRDLQVQRAWLRAEEERLPGAARREAEALLAALEAEVPAARRRAARAIARAQPSLMGWEARLGVVPARLWVGVPTVVAPYAWAVAGALAAGRDALEAGLGALRHGEAGAVPESARDAARATAAERLAAEHALRVLLKGHRALLAPLSATGHPVAAWQALATRGQELLGAVRDAALLAQRARAAGAIGVAGALGDVMLAHRDAFALGWGERPGAVLGALDEAVAWLRQAAPPVTPVGVPVEVERKYLLRALPAEAAAAPAATIAQGWLPGSALRERLRHHTDADGAVTLTRTVKLGPAAARLEVEEDTTPALFDALWPLTAGARVTKRRHTVVTEGVAWEVDDFTDRALVLAEVEQRGEAPVPPPPAWLAPYIVRDVTSEPEFTNAALARPAASSPAC
jgi:adenylate cyclase